MIIKAVTKRGTNGDPDEYHMIDAITDVVRIDRGGDDRVLICYRGEADPIELRVGSLGNIYILNNEGKTIERVR